MKKTIPVVAAIIKNEHNQTLCALRSPQMSLPNYWEFPGGKVEPGETFNEAIRREILEELNCVIEPLQLRDNYFHEYENLIVHFITIDCQLISGTPIAKEHAKLMWVDVDQLEKLRWAPADIPAVKRLLNN